MEFFCNFLCVSKTSDLFYANPFQLLYSNYGIKNEIFSLTKKNQQMQITATIFVMARSRFLGSGNQIYISPGLVRRWGHKSIPIVPSNHNHDQLELRCIYAVVYDKNVSFFFNIEQSTIL